MLDPPRSIEAAHVYPAGPAPLARGFLPCPGAAQTAPRLPASAYSAAQRRLSACSLVAKWTSEWTIGTNHYEYLDHGSLMKQTQNPEQTSLFIRKEYIRCALHWTQNKVNELVLWLCDGDRRRLKL